MKTKRSLQSCPDSCQVSMNQPCSKACCCWCRGTCVRYHYSCTPAHSERGRSSSSSELRVDTVRCRYASRFTWTFFFFCLPFLEVPFFFFLFADHEIDCHGRPKSDLRGDFPPVFSLMDTTSNRPGFVLLYTAHPDAGYDHVFLHY